MWNTKGCLNCHGSILFVCHKANRIVWPICQLRDQRIENGGSKRSGNVNANLTAKETVIARQNAVTFWL